jgi:trigger factor
MQVTLSHNSATRKSIEIVFSQQTMETAFAAAIAKIAPKVKLPGFRPGKTPRSVLLSKYQREIASEVSEKLIEDNFWEAVSSIGLQPISRPAIEKADLVEGAEGKIKVQFDIAPHVNLPDYKSATLVKKKLRIDDAAVDRKLESMRKESAKLVSIEGAAAPGHFVVFNMKTKPQGMKTKFFEEQEIELVEGRLFDNEIIGMKIGETKKFSLTVPENDTNRSLAGKQIFYEVTVNELEDTVYPEINDEFAKDFGDYENLQALKDQIFKDLEEDSENEAIGRLQSDLLDKLLDAATFEIPSSMLYLQLDDYCREFMDVLDNRGISHKRINWRAYRQRRLVDAERAVRSGYLLQALGNAENIQVSDEEIDQEIKNWIEESKFTESFHDIKAPLNKRGATTEVKGRVRTTKIFDMLLKAATVTEEILDKAAYDNLLEVERRREEGIAQVRFDAGGLEGGDFEEQDSGGPEAIVPAEEAIDAEATETEAGGEEGQEPSEAAPAKRGRKKAAPAIEEAPPVEEEPTTPTKRGTKKADPEPEPDEKPKRGAKKVAPAPEPEDDPEPEPDEKPKRGRKKAAPENEEAPEPPPEEKPKRGRPKKSES